jgi:Flp pilus assembly protein protease CpaA
MLELFSQSSIFLIFLALVWMVIAVIQDFRKREVANWWNFSLIAFVLAFRAFCSINSGEIWYLLWGFIGLFFGFVLCNIFYYARLFAGGDAKLLMALGTILPLSLDWKVNLFIVIIFIAMFLLAGAIYGFAYSLILLMLNYRKAHKVFVKGSFKYRNIVNIVLIFGFILVILFIIVKFYLGIYLSFILILSPFLLLYAKAIEETCMNKFVLPRDLTVGDWLVKPLLISNKKIKLNWEGLSEKDLIKIQKYYKKKVLVRYGIPFTPAFIFGFILTLFLLNKIIFMIL